MCSAFNGELCSNGSLLLGYYAVYHTESLPTFRRNVLPPSSGSPNFIQVANKVISVDSVGNFEGIKAIERAERIDFVRAKWKRLVRILNTQRPT